MNHPNLNKMSQAELREYVLSHREDQAAFHAYIDKLHAEATWVDMPPLKSDKDFNSYPDFIQKIRDESGHQ